MNVFSKEDILKHPTLCMSPWVHLHVLTEGQVLPCCATDANDSLGNLSDSSLQELFNSESMKRIRKQLKRGEKPPSCSRCFKFEESGVESYRSFMNKRYAKHFEKVNQTTEDGEAKVFLPYWDIRFSNVCNFRCRTCALPLSSSWHEDEKYFNANPGPKYRKVIDKAADLWQQLEPHLNELEDIYFVGGEPLLMDEHWLILEELVKRKLFHVRLRYNTNLSVLTYKKLDAIPLWNLFRRVDIQASLDGFGERAEYIRKGQNWEQTIKNWRRIRSEVPNARMTVNPTVSVLNIHHLPDFHRQWMEESLIAADEFLINILLYPLFYRVQILAKEMKLQITDKIEKHLQWLETKATPTQFEVTKERYQSLIQFMNKEDHQDQLTTFIEKTKALDSIRNENFKETFPEFSRLNEAIKIINSEKI